MAVGANIPDLAALYDQLKNSMQDADTIMNQLDSKLTQANEEWRSKGAHEFNDAWHNGFKPSLTKLCQALATAGTTSPSSTTRWPKVPRRPTSPAPDAGAVAPLTRSVAPRTRGRAGSALPLRSCPDLLHPGDLHPGSSRGGWRGLPRPTGIAPEAERGSRT